MGIRGIMYQSNKFKFHGDNSLFYKRYHGNVNRCSQCEVKWDLSTIISICPHSLCLCSMHLGEPPPPPPPPLLLPLSILHMKTSSHTHHPLHNIILYAILYSVRCTSGYSIYSIYRDLHRLHKYTYYNVCTL